MKAVGTKVLKDNLSKYLRMVREGETILVTDRDEVIAEIHRPTQPVPGKVSRWEAFLNEEARRGSVTRSRTGKLPSIASLLDSFLEALECKRIDDDILRIISENALLANCRSLDAIHVATALYFRPYQDDALQVVTLDRRMGETAVAAGFAVLPPVPATFPTSS
jgi:antitoxin (DNA-binding transcriptional repressor) of toxin-antitoxin stability system